AFIIVAVDLILHRFQALSTLFFAAFAYFSARFLWLHWLELRRDRRSLLPRLTTGVARLTVLGGALLLAWAGYTRLFASFDAPAPTFFLREIPIAVSGLGAANSDILNRVDPGIAHIAKWLLSAGDAVAVADFDNDGFQDL